MPERAIDNPKEKPALNGRVERMDSRPEPLLGTGAPGAIAYAISWFVSLFLVYWLTH